MTRRLVPINKGCRRSGKFNKQSNDMVVKVNKAKLIKRKEWLEQRQVTQRQARLAAAAKMKGETVRNWVERYQAAEPPNARAMFAALFAKPSVS